MVQIDFRSDVPDALAPDESERISEALAAIARRVEVETDVAIGEIRYLLVSEAAIAELHHQYFSDPSPTDIITFPGHDLTYDQHVEGDVAICLEVARRQASEAGHSLCREIVFLGAHGILHLCGWDDRLPQERAAMLAHQESLLQSVEQRIGML